MAHFFISAVVFLTFTASAYIEATTVNNGKAIWCHQAKVHEVRIQNCAAEPCTIRKGDKVPVEIDFEFQVPASTNKASLSIFISYWSKPPGFYGSVLGGGNSCSALGLPCPVTANTRYTIKSSIYVDPESKDTLNGAETGQKRTDWTITISENQNSYSTCNFKVQLNITK